MEIPERIYLDIFFVPGYPHVALNRQEQTDLTEYLLASKVTADIDALKAEIAELKADMELAEDVALIEAIAELRELIIDKFPVGSRDEMIAFPLSVVRNATKFLSSCPTEGDEQKRLEP